MFKETIENNAESKANTKELEALKKYFPSCFDKEGKFDIKIFEELVKTEEVDIKKEGYSLNFLGKSYARYLSSLDSETVIVPDENNKDIDSENIYIVGDNLDALQHLKYSYSEKIKCIYIDPPYNTGSDGFVYNDKFEFTAEELAKKINIEDDEAERILNMQGKSTHSAWLTFMYPRLELAKELLSDDGVIFISIDDNEQANLKKLCDEIFGESNFVAQMVRKMKSGSGHDSTHLAIEYEYILVVAKYIECLHFNKEIVDTDLDKKYRFADEYVSRRGKFYLRDLDYKGSYSASLDYPIETPDGNVLWSGGKQGAPNTWRWSKEKFYWGIENGYIVFKENKVYIKQYQFVDNNDKLRIRTLPYRAYVEFLNSEATNEIKSLVGDAFSYPKPTSLVKYLLVLATNKNDIVLDFFSGSATTAHAVMQLNAEDNGNRKYIMVQLPEETDEKSEAYRAGYKTIDEIGRERIRRAAAKIKKEEPEKSKNVDLKFKTYYLQDIDTNTLDKIREFNPDMPIDAKDIQDKFGKDAIIETWKIRDGFGFNASLEEINLSRYTAYKVSDSKVGTYLYLLDDMESEAIQELVRQLEAFELNVDKIIEYGYSFSYNANTALRANLKTLKNKNAVDVLIRY